MGCTSSTQIIKDPVTGETKQKKTLGGAYPGNRRVAKPVYQPSADEYKQINSTTAVADAHFVTCPGGNALRLVGKPNRADGDGGKEEGLAKFISVTLPETVQAGDVIHVRAPDGRMNAITVPEGMGPGSTFTVEFADNTPLADEELDSGSDIPTVMARPETPGDGINDVQYDSQNAAGSDVVASATTGPYVPAVYASSNSKG